ncbi:MAG: hypothetical protein LBU68_02870 [Rickettsiales bacterium]|jgi:hypothetical protein|nr:hypothetical protein [Rickettsiales bacterium]
MKYDDYDPCEHGKSTEEGSDLACYGKTNTEDTALNDIFDCFDNIDYELASIARSFMENKTDKLGMQRFLRTNT